MSTSSAAGFRTIASAVTRAVARTTAVAAGNTAASLGAVSFTNVGTTDATVAGAALAPGESVAFNAYLDESTNEFVKVPAIAYVASATAILRIATQA